MAPKTDPTDKLIKAAMTLAAERPWQEIGYREISAAAGLRLDQAYAAAPSKSAILEALSRRADMAVLAEPAASEDGTARDRLFDVLMRRFDALRPWRQGLASVAAAAGRDPAVALCGAGAVGRGMRAMLLAAGVPVAGLSGLVKVKGLSAIWLATLRDFLRDDSEDLGRTMASLDAKLRRVEGWLDRCSGRRRRAAGDEAAASAPAA